MIGPIKPGVILIFLGPMMGGAGGQWHPRPKKGGCPKDKGGPWHCPNQGGGISRGD